MNIQVVKTIFYEQLMLPPCNVLFIIWSEVGTSQKLKRRQNQVGVILRENTCVYHVLHIFLYLH